MDSSCEFTERRPSSRCSSEQLHQSTKSGTFGLLRFQLLGIMVCWNAPCGRTSRAIVHVGSRSTEREVVQLNHMLEVSSTR